MKKPSTKTITATLSIAVCTLLLCSCIMKKPDYGPTVKKTMTVPSFNSVELNGNTAVYFLQGKEYSVRLEGKKKLLDRMKIGVKNNVLNVNSTDEAGSNEIVFFGHSHQGDNTIKVYITSPTLTQISQDGNGLLVFPDSVTLDIEGNSAVKAHRMTVGQFDMELSGNAGVKFQNLTARRAAFDISGNAGMEVNFDRTDTASFDVSGNAGIKLTGTTRRPVQQNVTGNGGITDHTTRTK
mgnify:CR=1 FL=1